MRTTAIQEQLAEIHTSLQEAELQRTAAAAELSRNPGDSLVRKRLRGATQSVRELREDQEALQAALAEAQRHDQSDAELERRQHARNLVKVSIKASQDRVKKAAAVDQAINNLGAALRDLSLISSVANTSAMKYLSIAHQNDPLRQGDHAIVFQGEARGDGYIVPAIGKALGQALRDIELPNMLLHTWLEVGANPGCTVEEAASVCANRYAPRVGTHLAHHVGLEEPGDDKNN